MAWSVQRSSAIVPSVGVESKVALVVILSVLGMAWIPNDVVTLAVVKDVVRDSSEALRVIMCISPLPSDLVAEVFDAEDFVAYCSKHVAYSRPAVQIKGAVVSK
jgi:hypothetical protein